MIECESCGKEIVKTNYATLVVNKDNVIFTWTYCDAYCIAKGWNVVQ